MQNPCGTGAICKNSDGRPHVYCIRSGKHTLQYAGVEAQIIEALADIPLRMISYGSNDSDVAFVIKTEDKKKALQALSNKLFEPETDKIIK